MKKPFIILTPGFPENENDTTCLPLRKVILKLSKHISKEKQKLLSRIFLLISGISRTLFLSFFGLVINYVLLHYKQTNILNAYVFCIATVNLLFVFSNWGGKEYLTVTLSKNHAYLLEKSSKIISNRIVFSILTGGFILFLQIEIKIKLFIMAYILIKTLFVFFDSLTTVLKNFHQVILYDIVLYGLFIVIVYLDNNTSNNFIFLFELLVFELLRLLFYMYIYRKYFTITLKLNSAFEIAKQSFPYFLLSVSGFLSTKVDLYVVGIMLTKKEMSVYFVILNLVSFCQVAYASLINTYSSNIYRLSESSFKKLSKNSIYISTVISILSGFVVYSICNFYYGIDFDFLFTVLVISNIFIFNFVLLEVFDYNKKNKQRDLPKIFFIAGILNLLLSLGLTSILGLKGAFLSTTLTALFCFILLKYNVISKKQIT